MWNSRSCEDLALLRVWPPAPLLCFVLYPWAEYARSYRLCPVYMSVMTTYSTVVCMTTVGILIVLMVAIVVVVTVFATGVAMLGVVYSISVSIAAVTASIATSIVSVFALAIAPFNGFMDMTVVSGPVSAIVMYVVVVVIHAYIPVNGQRPLLTL